MLRVTRTHAVAFRARAMHLDERLPAGALARAAWGGLQDSAPRTAQLSLQARVHGVDPTAWEDPSLVQVYGPRAAVYAIPAGDAEVFTRGLLPRDPEELATTMRLADTLLAALDGEMRTARETARRLGAFDASYRAAFRSGLVHLRWDTRDSWFFPAPQPTLDAEDARRELARRFVRWFAPTTQRDLARWAGIAPRDATETWGAIAPELRAVELDGEPASVHTLDEDAIGGAAPVAGVRLLPPGDPWFASGRQVVVPDDEMRALVFAPPAARPRTPDGRAFLPGAIWIDGEVRGIWARVGRTIRLRALRDLPRGAVEAEAEAMGGALGGAMDVSWM